MNKSSKSEFRAEQFESIPQTWNAIFETVSLIPQGRVTTYGLIARYLKLSGGARTVGWALNHLNKSEHSLPAHRVVNRSGCLTGYLHFGGSNRMQQLLEAEGIVVQDMKVVHFSDLVWDPETELRSRL